MNRITVVFTKRDWNPGSFLIRWSLPRTRFHKAIASHCLVKDGDFFIEASMTHGVRRVHKDEALKGQRIVAEIDYEVENATEGIEWLRTQVGLPYDWKGAVGLSIAPDRDWMEPDKWFCFELAAATLAKAGRNDFRDDAGHISGTLLMAIKPNKNQPHLKEGT